MDSTNGGRSAFNHVLMFRILLLQAMHGLSDERCEYLIKVSSMLTVPPAARPRRSSRRSVLPTLIYSQGIENQGFRRCQIVAFPIQCFKFLWLA
ncbi:transposase [Teichococcus vastitatis]|uniref:transposase n=1 Tax=Teichococcus vastitatis TaxID=2307076 RepID=UPI0038D182B3